MEFPPTPEATRTGGEVPHVTASQASALLRSAMAISTELMGAAFPEITKTLLDELSGKWDFDVGSPLVQRHLAAKSDALFHEFMARLQETQDQYLNDLTVGRSQGPAPALDSETLSLVDSISVESTTIVDRHASKIAGHAEYSFCYYKDSASGFSYNFGCSFEFLFEILHIVVRKYETFSDVQS